MCSIKTLCIFTLRHLHLDTSFNPKRKNPSQQFFHDFVKSSIHRPNLFHSTFLIIGAPLLLQSTRLVLSTSSFPCTFLFFNFLLYSTIRCDIFHSRIYFWFLCSKKTSQRLSRRLSSLVLARASPALQESLSRLNQKSTPGHLSPLLEGSQHLNFCRR